MHAVFDILCFELFQFRDRLVQEILQFLLFCLTFLKFFDYGGLHLSVVSDLFGDFIFELPLEVLSHFSCDQSHDFGMACLADLFDVELLSSWDRSFFDFGLWKDFDRCL